MKPLLHFIVDGKLSATHLWDCIPRVGDTVILNGGDLWIEVTKVIWSDDSAVATFGIHIRVDRQWVQIICKKTDDLTKD